MSKFNFSLKKKLIKLLSKSFFKITEIIGIKVTNENDSKNEEKININNKKIDEFLWFLNIYEINFLKFSSFEFIINALCSNIEQTIIKLPFLQ